MRVLLRFPWTFDGKHQKDLFKFVEMPCLPPVGCEICVDDTGGGLDLSTVVDVSWEESHPEFYEVSLDEQAFGGPHEDADTEGGCTLEDNLEWFQSLGWSQKDPRTV